MAFAPINDQAVLHCPEKVRWNKDNSIYLFNFGHTLPNECQLANVLNSSVPVLYLTGNTYPRWPVVQENFFLKHYQPTSRLLDVIPWNRPKYSWRNAGWHAIKHSAPQAKVDWSSTNVNDDTNILQLWSDWYTILLAKRVIHTHSDFSISAIHWMNIQNTKTVMGLKSVEGQAEKVLDLIDESWRRDGETIPLRDRNRVDVSLTDNDMRQCQGPLGFM